MQKSAIKTFSVWARRRLIADIVRAMQRLGITADGIAAPLPPSTATTEFYDIGTREPHAITGAAVRQRAALAARVRSHGYAPTVEAIAYTWFNRLIALRFLEVNDYLPMRLRVLSSESPEKIEPDIVTHADDCGLDFTADEREALDAARAANDMDGAFRLLFRKACNRLAEDLPALFETPDDATELLLTLSVTDPDGVVRHLIRDIPEEDFDVAKGGQVEIIGWLYQYYNTEPKDAVFAGLKKNQKITKATIPAATQLFTPDWIVRYMVENSLGRLWLEAHPEDSAAAFGWKYYLPEAEQTPGGAAQLAELRAARSGTRPEDLTLLDPCCGSGHVLVYAFDVLMQIYLHVGYSEREAVESILTKNLYGLDIDDRAFQLSYFALYMKACEYGGRRILKRHIPLHLAAIEESNGMTRWEQQGEIALDETYIEQANELIDLFHDAKEYGSLLTVPENDYAGLLAKIDEVKEQGSENLLLTSWIEEISERMPALVRQAEMLAKQYDVVVTNPPYISNMEKELGTFLQKGYPNGKDDVYAAFIERCLTLTKDHGECSMVTMQSWMFLHSYHRLRENLLKKYTLQTINHLGMEAFELPGKIVSTVAFSILKLHIDGYKGRAIRLTDYYDSRRYEKAKAYFYEKHRYVYQQELFSLIPESPVSYWLTQPVFDAFRDGTLLSQLAEIRVGLQTSNNDHYLRLWYECNYTDCEFYCTDIEYCNSSDAKWYPHNKGGHKRAWYGNNIWVVFYQHGGEKLASDPKAAVIPIDYVFKPAITYSRVSTKIRTFRWQSNYQIFDSASVDIFLEGHQQMMYLGLFNSVVGKKLVSVVSPTTNAQPGEISKVPIMKMKPDVSDRICHLAQENVDLAKVDWDSFETSWDFQTHPLLTYGTSSLADAYAQWQAACEQRFLQLKANEEELNRIFIDIYGLADELTPDVADKDVTVARIYDTADDIPASMKGNNYVLTRADVIRSLVSYAVGCMFGRYSLDAPGLAFAGGTFDPAQYQRFRPDDDGVLPITDEDYFEDDIVGQFTAWMRAAFGAEHLEENLAFVADALGTKGTGSRDCIRTYFLRSFYADHAKTYQHRPIYWLYDSGKAFGFRALIYLHRYDADTTGRVRMDYLHKMQQTYEREVERMERDILAGGTSHELAKARKRKAKLQRQISECRAYDEQIAPAALARIPLDLDDGVKVNHEKAQTVDGETYAMLAKV